MEAPPLTEEELNEIYNWVDEIPLTRPKKNITRDFADGVLVAEIVAQFVPRLVEIHNYSAAHEKVFKKMGFQLSKNDINAVVNCVPEAVERVLRVVKGKIEKYLQKPQQERMKDYAPTLQQTKRVGPEQFKNNVYSQNYGYPPDQYGGQQGFDERDSTIAELRETIEILELKIRKLEQLITLKDSKIQTLQNKLAEAGIR